MYWQEDDNAPVQSGEDIVDLNFRINCKMLPVDHAWYLSQALLKALPWLADEPNFGLHPVHVTEYGNGWQRPEGEGAVINLSKRARMGLRLPRSRVAEANSLIGKTLDIDHHTLIPGESKIQELKPITTLNARYVVCAPEIEEAEFVEHVVAILTELGVPVSKLLCGRTHVFNLPDRQLHLRSLMLASLSQDHSLLLQRSGIGPHRNLGCGVFIPHKGIDAVAKPKE